MFLIYTFQALIISDNYHNNDRVYPVLDMTSVIYLRKVGDPGLIIALKTSLCYNHFASLSLGWSQKENQYARIRFRGCYSFQAGDSTG
jgi:hypothetical protein